MERNEDLPIDRRALEPLMGRVVTKRLVTGDGQVRRAPLFVRMFTLTELRDWLIRAGFPA